MIAILTNDAKALSEAVDMQEERRGAESRRWKLLHDLLTKAHTFQPAGEPHHRRLMLTVFRNRLLESPPFTGSADHLLQDPDRALDAHLKAYRGHVVHVAAALGRPETVSKLVEAGDFFRSGRQEQLTARDSEGNTALVLAVQSGSCRTTGAVVKKLLALTRPEFNVEASVVGSVVRDAVRRTTYSICRNPGMRHSVQLLLKLGRWQRYYSGRDVSLLWPIYLHDLKMLVELMSQRREFDLFRMPHELHYAVMLYSRTIVSSEEEGILDYLTACRDLAPGKRQVRADDVCSLEVAGRVEVNGTAFHFALSGLRHEVCLPHPGYGWGPYRHGAVDPERLNPGTASSCSLSREPLGPDSPLVQVLNFLGDKGASITKPNRFRKTPLGCLPSSADPCLVDLIIDIMREQEEEEEGEEGGGGGGREVKRDDDDEDGVNEELKHRPFSG